MLFGVDARNPGLYVLAALFVMGVVLLASLAPAIRAAHADAVESLR
jgi:ABC-type lipoprotein release transport system permease subunit